MDLVGEFKGGQGYPGKGRIGRQLDLDPGDQVKDLEGVKSSGREDGGTVG